MTEKLLYIYIYNFCVQDTNTYVVSTLEYDETRKLFYRCTIAKKSMISWAFKRVLKYTNNKLQWNKALENLNRIFLLMQIRNPYHT